MKIIKKVALTINITKAPLILGVTVLTVLTKSVL